MAKALLEHETIDGAEVKRLVAEAQQATTNGQAVDGRARDNAAPPRGENDTAATDMHQPASVRTAGP